MKNLPLKAIGVLILVLFILAVFADTLAIIPLVGPAAGWVSKMVRKIPGIGPRIPSL